MARRRLEAAIQAGKAIDSEHSKSKGTFTTVKSLHGLKLSELSSGIYSLQFSLDSDLLAVGLGDGGVSLYSSESGRLYKDVHKGTTKGLPVMALAFHPNEKDILVGAGADGMISAWNIQTLNIKFRIREPHNEINALDFSLTGGNFATAGKDVCVRLYDAERNELLRKYEGSNEFLPDHDEAQGLGHGRRVFALKYHPDDDHIFVTGGWDDSLKIWDSRTSSGVQRTIQGTHVCGNAIDIKDGKILTASWVAHNSLQLWDFSTGRLESNIPFGSDSGEYLYTCQFCDNNVVLAGGSGTNSVKAINKNTFEVLGTVSLDKAVQALDSTNGGRYFALGGAGIKLEIASLE
ncbi:uncharacterized protein [Ptychodera flava]|uniref:uncharacterized protein n=1 Tax=Ptychodera flava TaxID=63121 RepID=UPI003969F53D